MVEVGKKTPNNNKLARAYAKALLMRLLLGIIRTYQLLLSPLLGPRCRFYPSCSDYAKQAITLHGPTKGTWLSLKRISHCHPGHPGGIDEVPNAPTHSHSTPHRN